MKNRVRYDKYWRTTNVRIWLAEASRYLTHLIILLIAAGAFLLAGARLPQAQGATLPAGNPVAISSQPQQRDVIFNPSGSGTTDDAIQRNFAPLTSTTPISDTTGTASHNISQRLITYTVQTGDTLFDVAFHFGLHPETVLWSNYSTLKDNPDLLSVGQELVIPPTDGLINVVQEGDSIDSLARQFQVKPEAIIKEPLNHLTSVNQLLVPGQQLFIPGGQRETVVWQVPKPVVVRQTTTNTGQTVKVYRVGTCGEMAIPPLGTGSFIWPSNNHYLSGYNFSAWHPGIDIADHMGDPIYAADSGTVIYAGYSLNKAGVPVGYGQYVVIDHGDGYQTLYAHASRLFVRCGQQVLKGSQIAAVGSVGNSTGPHLHFEIRRGGSAVNPWTLLPK